MTKIKVCPACHQNIPEELHIVNATIDTTKLGRKNPGNESTPSEGSPSGASGSKKGALCGKKRMANDESHNSDD